MFAQLCCEVQVLYTHVLLNQENLHSVLAQAVQNIPVLITCY